MSHVDVTDCRKFKIVNNFIILKYVSFHKNQMQLKSYWCITSMCTCVYEACAEMNFRFSDTIHILKLYQHVEYKRENLTDGKLHMKKC